MNLHAEQEVVTLSEICRACLVKTSSMKHLLEPNNEVVGTITKLSSISNVQIEINDILPCFLCSSCEEKLKISYDFQQLCQKSHSFILSCLSTSSVSFKVNSFKPLPFVGISDGPQPQLLDNNTDSFVSFVDSDGLVKKVQISCYSAPDIDTLNYKETDDIVKDDIQALDDVAKDKRADTDNESVGDNPENVPQACTQPACDTIKDEELDIKDIDVVDENEEKPVKVEKKIAIRQIIRLPQFQNEAIQKIMEEFRQRYMKHIDCLHCGFTASNSRALSVHMTRVHKDLRENWCFLCNDHFANIREHINTFHKDCFKCPLCAKYMANSSRFMEHLLSHSSERGYFCKQCCKCFISARHLKAHLETHKAQNSYKCQLCPKTFRLPSTLESHLEAHKKYKCTFCLRRFFTNREYIDHKCFPSSRADDVADAAAAEEESAEPESKQESEKSLRNFCEKCNKRVRSLEQHKADVRCDFFGKQRKKESASLCPYCGKTFKGASVLSLHVRLHTGEMPYKCTYCDKRVRTKIQLVSHERTHTGERPHKCKFCKKAFAQSSVLNTHMKQHTGKSEECFMCHKKFCRPSELKVHMRTHTGEKPYECKICGEQFANRSRLTDHTRHHTDERPYQCEYCDKQFKQNSTLKSHMNIHLGKKPFQCSQCPYASRHAHCLKQHLLQHEEKSKAERLQRCEICGQSFVTFEIYSLHYRNEHKPSGEEVLIEEGLTEAPTVEVIDHLQEFT